jgi:hypothetical protein
MTIATFQHTRAGHPLYVGYECTDRTAQEFADMVAARTNPDYCDEVQVWFGYRGDGGPDATAKVPA